MYAPEGVDEIIVTFRVAVPVPPVASLTITLVNPVFVELFKSETGPLVMVGEIEAVRVTEPENPKLFSVMPEVENPAAVKLRLGGLALTLKSATTVTLTETE